MPRRNPGLTETFQETRVTASGKLRMWSYPAATQSPVYQELNANLERLITEHANAVIMTPTALVPRNPKPITPLLAVLDKIVSRGNPTTVDHRWEDRHLAHDAAPYARTEPNSDPELISRQLTSLPQFPGNPAELATTAAELWNLPFHPENAKPQPRTGIGGMTPPQATLYHASLAALAPHVSPWLRPEVHLADLANHDTLPPSQQKRLLNRPLTQRIDLALHYADARIAVTVQDPQGNPASAQARGENAAILKRAGWTHLTVSPQEIMNDLGIGRNPFRSLLEKLPPAVGRTLTEPPPGHPNIQAAVAADQAYAAALELVIRPAVMQRTLRALLHILHNQQAMQRPCRILLIDEDLTVGGEALLQLTHLWETIRSMAPAETQPPEFDIHYSADPDLCRTPVPNTVQVNDWETTPVNYDLVIDHSAFLSPDQPGAISEKLPAELKRKTVRIRPAHGQRNNLQLLPAKPMQYRSNPSDTEPQLRYLTRLIFGKKELRDGQLPAIARLIHRQDTITLLPTGAGKSLIYQLSGILLNGATVIVAPINSLIQDQVENLQQYGIHRIGIVNSVISRREQQRTLNQLSQGKLNYIYITPERMQNREFRKELAQAARNGGVPLAAIDEAHCASEWSHDFRPSYLNLAQALRANPDRNNQPPTVAAFTGTASYSVIADIRQELQLRSGDQEIRPRSFDRPELNFAVIPCHPRNRNRKLREIRNELRKQETPAIVFNARVNGPQGVAATARALEHDNYLSSSKPREYSGSNAQWNQRKTQLQEAFSQSDTLELVSTKTLGMGLDKSNIRYTLHRDMPNSIAAFYQEAGRAGRDRQPARAVILYADQGWPEALKIIGEQDHVKAARMLNAVPYESQGDALSQLYTIIQEYPDAEREINGACQLYADVIAPALPTADNRPVNVTVPWENATHRNATEKYIYRLALLGIVTDYTLDYQRKVFEIQAQRRSENTIIRNLTRRLALALSLGHARRTAEKAGSTHSGSPDPIPAALRILIEFSYRYIAGQRKEEVRNIAELCRSNPEPETFRNRMLEYLTHSQFTDQLLEWLHEPASASPAAIREIVAKADTENRLRQLASATQRSIEANPGNRPLRATLIATKSRSRAYGAETVIAEVNLLAACPPEPSNYHIEAYAISALLEKISSEPATQAALTLLQNRPDPDFSRILGNTLAGFKDQKVRLGIITHQLRELTERLEQQQLTAGNKTAP